MDFLEKMILDNPVKDYLIVGGTILLILIARRILSAPLALLTYHFFKKFLPNIDRKNFIELIIKPMGWFITIMVAIASVSSLTFPEAWNFSLLGKPFRVILERIDICLVIITCIWLLVRITDFTASILLKRAGQTEDKRDDQIITFTRDLLKIILTITGILLVIRLGLKFNVGSLLTGLSIIGAALALAAKETIENLIGSFIIFMDKPFNAGDIVKVNNINGIVEHIGLRSTRIRTNDKTLVSVPNKQMVDSVVDNWSNRTERRCEIRLELSVQTSTSKIKGLSDAVKKKLESCEAINKFTVFYSDLAKVGKTLTIEYFTNPIPLEDFNNLKEELNYSFAGNLEDLSIDMASGTNVTILSEGGATSARPDSII